MKTTETDRSSGRTDTFIIAKSDDGYRVCSPLTPATQYVVTGIPNDPQCTCADYAHPDRPPDWLCEHILAVLSKVNAGHEANGNGSPVPATDRGSSEPPSGTGKNGNGKTPGGRSSKGVLMLLKRSVSPDGRIDSLSVEFTCPIGSVTTGGIKELARVIVSLQGEIAADFLKTNGKNGNGNGSRPHNGNGSTPANAVPGQLLGVASMPSRWGQRLFLNVLVNGQVLKFFGSQKELAQAVKSAGYPSVADCLADGYTMNLPCRVVTKPNGRYVNVERIYPAEAGVPQRA